MSSHDVFAQMFDVGKDILTTYLDKVTSVILAQIGDSTSSVPDADAAEWWQHTGFWSRPAKPTQGNASCQGLVIKRGDRDVIYASRDTRNSSTYGKLADGETCVGASTGQARSFWKADGSHWAVTTLGNTAGGTTIAAHLGSDGSYTIQLPNAVFSIGADGTITLGNAAGGLKIDPVNGPHLFGKIVKVQASGVAMISGDVKTVVGPSATIVPGIGALFGTLSPGGSTAAPAASSSNVVISP